MMQAKDISDDEFIKAVQICSLRTAKLWGSPNWTNRMDVQEELKSMLGHEIPWKIIVAKAKAVIKKGRMAGCTCGCRGDFDLRGFPDDPFAMSAP